MYEELLATLRNFLSISMSYAIHFASSSIHSCRQCFLIVCWYANAHAMLFSVSKALLNILTIIMIYIYIIHGTYIFIHINFHLSSHYNTVGMRAQQYARRKILLKEEFPLHARVPLDKSVINKIIYIYSNKNNKSSKNAQKANTNKLNLCVLCRNSFLHGHRLYTQFNGNECKKN